MNSIFCELKKTQKVWISFSQSCETQFLPGKSAYILESRVIFHKEIFRICRIQSSSPICHLFQRVCRVGTSHCDGGRTTPRMIFKDGGSPIKSCWKVIEIQIETHFRNVYLIWFSKQPDFRQFQSNHGSPCACADSIRLCGFKHLT